jgi:radical SAM protein with 4Fe4S-binding SPASM domain
LNLRRNIKALSSAERNIVVGARPTITPLTVDKQKDIVRYFHQLGVKAIYSDPVFPPVSPDVQSVSKIPYYSEFLMNYAEEFIAAQEVANGLGVFYGSILAVNFDEKTELACRSCIPSPHITTDGYVTCCDMSYMENVLPELIYGKYDFLTKKITYDNKKIQAIKLRRASNLLQCAGCEVLYHCAGGCFGEGLNETGHLLGVKTDYCEAIKFLAKHLDINNGLYPYLHP